MGSLLYLNKAILKKLTGSVRNFATAEELDRFIKLNYPDSALPEMMKLEKFYNLMWQAIEKIKQADPQKLSY